MQIIWIWCNKKKFSFYFGSVRMRKPETLDPTRTTRKMPGTTRDPPVRSKLKRVSDRVSPAGSQISTGRWLAKPLPRNQIVRDLPALRPELVTRPPMSMPRWERGKPNKKKKKSNSFLGEFGTGTSPSVKFCFYSFIFIRHPLGRSDRVRRIGFEITAGRRRRHLRLCGRSDDQGRDDRIRRNSSR